MNRTLARLLALMLLPVALLAAGCFQIENHIVVNEDGSGTQTIRFALPADFLAGMGMGQELPSVEELESEADMQAMRGALQEGEELRFFSSEEEGIGFEMTLLVGVSDDFAAALEARGADLEAAMPSDVLEGDVSLLDMVSGGDFQLARDGDEWVFEYRVEPLDSAMLGELAGDPQAGMMAEFFDEQMTVQTTLQLPGEVTEHNADEVLEDGTLVWTQTGFGTSATLSARSDVGGGLSTMMMAGLLIGGLVVVLALVGYLLLGRKRVIV